MMSCTISVTGRNGKRTNISRKGGASTIRDVIFCETLDSTEMEWKRAKSDLFNF